MSVFKLAGLATAAAVVIGAGYSQLSNSHAASSTFVNADNVAASGYDVVAYKSAQAAVAGNAAYTIRDGDVKYRFASAASASQFETDPNAYKAEFGGWCAYGIRMGKKLPVNPEAFQVVDGKLYMFLDQATMNVWLEDRDANLDIARKTWPELG